jgi:hypothetical protein
MIHSARLLLLHLSTRARRGTVWFDGHLWRPHWGALAANQVVVFGNIARARANFDNPRCAILVSTV